MTNHSDTQPTLTLAAGLDRALAWTAGGSVRHLVAELSADAAQTQPDAQLGSQGGSRRAAPALNLAMAIDVSGSMAGAKLANARQAAQAVAQDLGPDDRLTLVAFASHATLLLDACAMDAPGHAMAVAALARLELGGNTDLFSGWLLAAEHLAIAKENPQRASHRLVLMSDGQANAGVTDAAALARHTGELLARGIITSTVGIGDGYDEALLGAMAEAGGGRLHDAEHPGEIAEVVLAELRDGRGAALERARLHVTVPANMRAELVGPWSHSVLPGALDILVGTLLPGHPRSVVVRLHCPSGAPGDLHLVGVAASATLPDGAGDGRAGVVDAAPVAVGLRLADGRDNTPQARDPGRSVAVLHAWQAMVLRRAVQMNRDGDSRAAGDFLKRELHWIERYARGLPGAEQLLAELVQLHRRSAERWDERTRKDIYAASSRIGRAEPDARAAERAALLDVLQRKQP